MQTIAYSGVLIAKIIVIRNGIQFDENNICKFNQCKLELCKFNKRKLKLSIQNNA